MKTRVLLVEDNLMLQSLMQRRLTRSGFEVSIATEGRECLEIVHKLNPDLILMDMSMPGLNGWDTTRQLRRNSHTRNIPIIALTAHAMKHDRDKALSVGCNDYISKPVDMDALLKKMEVWMED